MDKWINHPTIIKLIAVGLGILMWAVVHFDPEATPNTVSSLVKVKTIEAVKVQAYGLDEKNYVLVGLEPQQVKLTVSGTSGDLIAKAEDYKLQVDLRTAGEGTHTLKIDYSLPRGISLVDMTPSTVTVTIVTLQTKEFEVNVSTIGNPAAGYKAGTPIIKPSNRVHVTLPSNDMARVAKVGGSISIKGNTETIKSKSVKLAAYDENGNVIDNAVIDPAVLEVEVPITNPFKTVPLQIKLVGNMPPGLSIASFKPDVEQVTVYGPQTALDQLDFLEVEVQLSELKNSGKVTVVLTSVASIVEIAPKKVDITVEVVLSETRTLEGLPIMWKGLGDGLTMTIIEPASGKADIVVKGAPAILGNLKPGDVDVYADLNGKGPGTHTIPLSVNLERFMTQAGGTSSITVEIVDEAALNASEEDTSAVDGIVDGTEVAVPENRTSP
ncbi:MAG: CdaR family protein [Candidatus Cohnella colombiensis]|uniref:CdaR family protein n=1 Tax=Candidatus Cohnella colombiensis TaxID=3121368 RepID=A0AA95EVY5_9BACL|nr:MAG: CdaR family protein [Cohnella sp.]